MKKKNQEEKKLGKLSIDDINNIINKKAGLNVAFNLNEEDPSSVKDWIPTGSRWLDSIIAKGKYAGIPVGKLVELSGESASGKSYMAAQICAQAQKKGYVVVYFDSESALDSDFLERIGIDLSCFTYVQATSVEFVFKTIEELLANGINYFFVWDSFANTPSEADIEDNQFNPQSSMAKIPRIATLGMKKLTIPIANSNSTLLVLNQLKTNIGDNAMFEPFFTPGGKALQYAYSLRIWLTARKAKDSFINDTKGFRIGTEVKVKLKKSRFGTEGRECAFKILWGDENPGIQDELSWLEAIRGSSRLIAKGAWKELVLNDGTSINFQEASWLEQLKNPKFKESVLSIIEEEVIKKFKDKTAKADAFYDVDKEHEQENINN